MEYILQTNALSKHYKDCKALNNLSMLLSLREGLLKYILSNSLQVSLIVCCDGLPG